MRDEILAVDAEVSVIDVLSEAAKESIKDRVVVLGNPGVDPVARQLIESLEQEDYAVEPCFFGRPRVKRVGIVGGLVQAGLSFLSSAEGAKYFGLQSDPETYFDYRQRIRDEEVHRQTRRPPKKAVCSSRRRGRKFKG